MLQVQDEQVIAQLQELKRNKLETVAGFLVKKAPDDETGKRGTGEGEPPSAVDEAEDPVHNASGMLREDVGKVTSEDELEEVGTMLQVLNVHQVGSPMPSAQLVVMPQLRVRRVPGTAPATPPEDAPALFQVQVEFPPDAVVSLDDDEELKAMHFEVISSMKQLINTSYHIKDQYDQVIRFYNLDSPARLADLVGGMSMGKRGDLQTLLSENDVKARMSSALELIKRDLEFAKLQSLVKTQVEEKVAAEQRKYMLMQQLKAIKQELGIEKDDKSSIIQTFREAIEGKKLSEEVEKVIETELSKLSSLEPASPEFNVCRSYLEWLTTIPWDTLTEDNTDIKKAADILDEDHYGLEDVKDRILEFMAVATLKGSTQGKILCMVGPPGVGKTSIGQSIARALGRKFYRFSVGGLHDVAELRGHRRTYVGAMPGKLIQCIKVSGSCNPVVLIDEIDKIGRDSYRGDPSSALLEILDPNQNSTFRDHYLDVAVDLSKVLFVCTANVSDTIPGPLLDRMEIIRLAGYVFEEKIAIASQYLIPQTREQCGVAEDTLSMDKEVLGELITNYAREAGVRNLLKFVEKIYRKAALKIVRDKEEQITVTKKTLPELVGQPVFHSERLYDHTPPPGVVMGLAWTAMGGTTLYVEAAERTRVRVEEGEERKKKDHEGERGYMKVTGQLGSVMGESAEIAMTYSRSLLRQLDGSNNFLESAGIHLHVPEGSTPKDGPSAGVTMCTGLVSLALNAPVNPVAMTGEITVTGKVLRVGGLKEKTIAARREGVKELIFPRGNERDYLELKEYLREGLDVHFVDHYSEVYPIAFANSIKLGLAPEPAPKK